MRHLMLALLDRGPAHGYELKRSHDELFGEVAPPVNVGQIYVTLGRLERDGLVVHHTEAGLDRPDRKVYEVTDVGRKTLRDWLAETSDLPVGKSDVILKLVAGLIFDGRVAPAVVEHRSRCLDALRRLATLGSRLDPSSGTSGVSVGDLLRRSSVLHLEAELKWLDLVEDYLRTNPDRPRRNPTAPLPNPSSANPKPVNPSPVNPSEGQ
ncbi:MAG: PadR family transcriptional regulator [Frankia sp.]